MNRDREKDDVNAVGRTTREGSHPRTIPQRCICTQHHRIAGHSKVACSPKERGILVWNYCNTGGEGDGHGGGWWMQDGVILAMML
jgi:hypothetical protein